MKKFLLMILVFFSFSLPSFALNEVNDKAQSMFHLSAAGVQEPLKKVVDNFHQALDNARQNAKEDVNLVENPEKFNLLSLFFLEENTGLLTGKKGLGEWQKTPFGDFRLLSCEGNLVDQTPLLLAIEAKINQGWTLKKPYIIPYQKLPQGIQSEEIFYPIHQVFVKNDNTYQDDVFFLMRYDVAQVPNEILFEKQIVLSAQHNDDDQQERILTLPLLMKKDKTSFQTDMCPALLYEFQQVPHQVQNDEVIVNAYSKDHQLIQLNMRFQKKIDYVNLQIDMPYDWDLEDKRINENNVQFLIKTHQPLPQGFDLSLKVLSSLKWYQLTVPIQSKDFQFMPQKMSWFDVIIAGILLFFLSPVLTCLCALNKKDKGILQRQSLSFCLGIWGLCVLGAFGFFFDLFPQDLFETQTVGLVIGIMVSCYLLWKAPYFNLLTGGICFLFMPKPYLTQITNQLTPYQLETVLVFIVWGVICSLPFYLLRKQVWFFDQLQKTGRHFLILQRFPAVCCLIWCACVLILPCFNSNKPFVSFEEIQQEINQDHLVYLSVENGYCFSCVLNQTMLNLTFNENMPQYHLTQYRLRLDREYDFMTQRKLPKDSYGLLFGNKKPYGEMINGYVTPLKWNDLLFKVHLLPDPLKVYMTGKDLTEQ